MSEPAQAFDNRRVDKLSGTILAAIRENYELGPLGRERAMEALNALASSAAVVISGCGGNQEAALEFFGRALRINVQYFMGGSNQVLGKEEGVNHGGVAGNSS